MLTSPASSSALSDVVWGYLGGSSTEDLWALVAWNLLVTPGDRVVGQLVSALGAAESWEMWTRTHRHADVLSLARRAQCEPRDVVQLGARYPSRPPSHRVDWVITQSAERGIGLIHPGSASWPTALNDLGDHRPLILWSRGAPSRPDDHPGPSVAVVGSRRSSERGRALAGEIATWVSRSHGTVVSGGARGIDHAAHHHALALGSGHIAVLASAHGDPYPPEHWALFDRIARSGWVITETPLGRGFGPSSFLHRNRLIAALADTVVVVEANWRSGALNTASHAQTLGRRLLVPVDESGRAMSEGTKRLLDEWGAEEFHTESD